SWHWSEAVHTTGFAPVQVPARQVSLCVQALPSSQVLPFGFSGLEHVPVAGVQVPAAWHWSRAVQTAGLAPVPVHGWQVSLSVQALPSLQVVPSVTLLCLQPAAGSQLSVVQALPSSQLSAGPPTHTPAEHWSLLVQALPSSHEPGTFVCTQPLAGLQESAVQTLSSLQSGGGPPTHVPAWHVSFVVPAFPSSQDAVLLTWTQPLTGSQKSSVHGFPSSQFGAAPPTQAPAEQASPVVQALPSLQEVPSSLGGFEHTPDAGSQVPAKWHWSCAVQTTALVPTQTPPR